jgi:DNA processing protein
VAADEWNEESDALLRLSLVRGIGPVKSHAVVRAFGSAAAAWKATFDEVCARADARSARCLRAGADEDRVESALRWREQEGRHLIAWNSSLYPPALREIADPPLLLYATGNAQLLRNPSIAVVGSRNATAQGRRDAFEFAHALSDAGLCIVSGMALGIDACAHEGGLAARGSSLAVLGTGIDRVYPRSNRALAQRLRRDGCLVTEFPLGTSPHPGNFPVRNRLISGLARGVLLVEAALESGSLGTARCAVEQNREVFAMPGSIHSPLAKGCHALIRQGAKLTECVDDVLVELGMAPTARVPEAAASLSNPVLDAMGFAPISLEQLALRAGLGVARTAQELSHLELEGRVALLAGGLFQRTTPSGARA